MKQKLITILLILLVYFSSASYAKVQIGILYYNLNETDKTAEVTWGVSKDVSSVHIPESVTYNDETYRVTSIGYGAFAECKILSFVSIPASVTNIGTESFSGCSWLKSIIIPNSVISIENSAFYDCYSLTSVTIGNSVNSIGNNAFCGCTGLASIVIPNSVTSIGEYAFSICKFSSVTLGNNVDTIGDYAFNSCSKLTSILIPNSVTRIGKGAFNCCTSLASISIPSSVTSLGEDVFSGCYNLLSINVENGNTTYDSRNNCNAIVNTATNTLISSCQNTSIPNSVTGIGSKAFYDCKNLLSIEIPNNVTIIGNNAFYGCDNLTSITIPNNVTDIEYKTFGYCKNLTSIAIGDNVTRIGVRAFEGCSSLTSIIIPASVTSIEANAFYGCYSLASFVLPNSVTYVGDNIFQYCDRLTAPIYNAHIFVFMPRSYAGNYAIPDGIKSIAGHAFSECDQLTSIIIPNSIMYIEPGAFYDCTNLSYVSVGDSVTSIGHYAFYRCNNLESIEFPNSLTSIGFNTFCRCSNLTSVTIPNNVTSIGEYAFDGCTNIISVTIGDKVTKIGDYAFRSCYQIKSVVWRAKNCNSYNFGSNVEYITFGNDVEVIPASLCTGMSRLKTMIIPYGVTSIGAYAFDGCRNLTSVKILAETPPILNNNTFNDYCSIYVPCGSIETYQTTWPYYTSNIKYEDAPFSLQLNVDSLQGKITQNKEIKYICDSVISISALPQNGYHFVQWSDGVLDNPRIIELTQDTSLTAEFAINTYTLSVMCEASEGSIEGTNGVFEHGTSHNFTAIPSSNYRFESWSDKVTDNPRTIILVQDTFITANFIRTYNVRFYDFNNELLEQQLIDAGGNAIAPEPPIVENYIFVGWDKDFTCVLSDLDIYSIYEPGTNGINDIHVNNNGTHKILHEGQIYILREGTIYTLQGKQLE